MSRLRSGVRASRWAATSSPLAAVSTSSSGFEKLLDPFPGIGDQAGGGAGRFEDPGRRRKSIAGHAFAIDVENRQG